MAVLLVLALTIVSVVSERPTTCRPGWTKAQGSCYLIVEESQTWAAAQSICDFLGADLLRIETATEDQFIQQTLKNKYDSNGSEGSDIPKLFWTSGNDFQMSGNWMWSKTTAMSYTGWNSDSPTNPVVFQNCVSLDEDAGFKWRNNDCATAHNFICEIQLQS